MKKNEENEKNEKKFSELTPEEKKKVVISEIISWLLTIGAAVALALIVTTFVVIKTEVVSGSMIHTIEIGDKVVGNRLSYLFSDPKRGQIIFFKFPDDETQTYVKRIIGLPGETVTIKNGRVYINDSQTPLEEPYLKEQMIGSFGPYEVPEGSYFVMGDNRNISIDSRFWENKFVTEDQIYAKAVLRWYPMDRFGGIDEAEYDE